MVALFKMHPTIGVTNLWTLYSMYVNQLFLVEILIFIFENKSNSLCLQKKTQNINSERKTLFTSRVGRLKMLNHGYLLVGIMTTVTTLLVIAISNQFLMRMTWQTVYM